MKGGSGAYRVKVKVIGGNIVGKRCQLVVRRHVGSRDEEKEVLPIKLEKTTEELAFVLANGRRKEKGPVTMIETVERRPTRQELIAKLMTTTLPNSIRANLSYAQFGAGNMNGAGTILQTGGQRGGGAVGYQPVIGVVNDGISLTVSAITTADRRYVKMAIAPAFNALVEVATFSFSN